MEYNLSNIVLFSLAASFGGMARYGLNHIIEKITPWTFPWGIFIVNILGCFGFGFIWVISEDYLLLDKELSSILMLGFMGSFTTFSSYIADCHNLIHSKKALFCNMIGQILFGLLAFMLAVWLAQYI